MEASYACCPSANQIHVQQEVSFLRAFNPGRSSPAVVAKASRVSSLSRCCPSEVTTPSPLVALCEFQEVWDLICSQLSGDSLSMVAVIPALRRATRQSHPFILLCGRTNDGDLCPWIDNDNVLRQPFIGWTDRHFRLRHSESCDSARLEGLGEVIVQFLLHNTIHKHPLHDFHMDEPPYARPPSPVGKPCHATLVPVYSPPQSPPCFPEELHHAESIRRLRHLDCMAIGTFEGSDYSSPWESAESSEDGSVNVSDV